MEYSPLRQHQHQPKHHAASSAARSEMAMLAASPAPPAGFPQNYHWDVARIPSQPPRPSQDSGSVSLPSIRLAFPEFHLPSTNAQEAPVYASSAVSPSSAATAPLASPTYVHSQVTHKRRRESLDDEQERERASQVPRMYRSPDHTTMRLHSPAHHPRSPDAWSHSSRRSPFSQKDTVPPPMEVLERIEPRPSLPSLPPSLATEQHAAAAPLARDRYENHPDHRRSGSLQQGLPPMDAASHRYQGSYPYEYAQPRRSSHMHSVSASPIHSSYERTPFSSGAYGRTFAEYPRYSDLGHIGISGDGKQRKRRGNLPKETTDKLRAWFMAHLSHPYPTEDEKQDLMRQTGLQMNQISNWFINARRRQLPTMINNARAETDAMTGRTGDGKILPTTERHDYDEELQSYQRHQATTIKRGSV